MSAFLFCGDIGSGKTYAGTTLALWLVKHGRKVAHNWHIDWPEDLKKHAIHFEDYADIMGEEDIDILADEAQNNAGARDWESMPKRVRNWLSQHRHFGNNLLFFTQHYKFVDIYIRRLAPKGVWSVHRLLNLTFAVPRIEPNPETGEEGRANPFGGRLFIRPWKDLDHPWPIGGLVALAKLSRLVPTLYRTRDRTTAQDIEKRPPAGGRPPAAARPPEPQAKLL